MSALRHLRAILFLPVMATLVIPAALVAATRALNVGWSLPSPLNVLPPLIGLLLIGLGLTLMTHTLRLFAALGRGTLAPWDPTQRLVVVGVYRRVRNPMISGVFAVLLGEAVALGSLPVLGWFLLFVLANLIYIPLSEEPGLAARFGDDYRLYCQHVPRWIPRLAPWQPSDHLAGQDER